MVLMPNVLTELRTVCQHYLIVQSAQALRISDYTSPFPHLTSNSLFTILVKYLGVLYWIKRLHYPIEKSRFWHIEIELPSSDKF